MPQTILSIITPVLNGEKYLRKFLQAVIDQKCPKVEHIILDGASSDNTLLIIKEFANQYPHIRYVSEKDDGAEAAINKGIAMARGDFVTLLCLADFYEPGTLNEVTAMLPNLEQPAFLVGNCKVLDEDGSFRVINKPDALTPLGILLKKEFPYNPVTYYYHKDLHKIVGPYHKGDQFDVEFLLRAFEVAKVHHVDKCWGNFWVLPGSMTHKLIEAGTLAIGRKHIFKRHLMTYPPLKRFFIRMLMMFNVGYTMKRIKYYLSNPKEAREFLSKRFVRK